MFMGMFVFLVPSISSAKVIFIYFDILILYSSYCMLIMCVLLYIGNAIDKCNVISDCVYADDDEYVTPDLNFYITFRQVNTIR